MSAPFIPQFFKEPLDASAPYWDYVICNETEAEAYAVSHDHKDLADAKDIRGIARVIANLPKANTKRPRTVIITQGTDPTIVAIQGQAPEEILELKVHKINPEQIVDTNGAGDAFAGGFVAGLVQGKDLQESVDMGQWLARLSIQELGPSYVFPFPLPSPLYIFSYVLTISPPDTPSLSRPMSPPPKHRST